MRFNMGLKDVSVKKLDFIEHGRGLYWHAHVKDEETGLSFTVSNAGKGGPCEYDGIDKVILSKYREEAKDLLNDESDEALDWIFSYLDPHLCVSNVIPMIKSEFRLQ